ncbi:hypothetical protein P4S72_23120 [Vibrio sp. PP-XX7]
MLKSMIKLRLFIQHWNSVCGRFSYVLLITASILCSASLWAAPGDNVVSPASSMTTQSISAQGIQSTSTVAKNSQAGMGSCDYHAGES